MRKERGEGVVVRRQVEMRVPEAVWNMDPCSFTLPPFSMDITLQRKKSSLTRITPLHDARNSAPVVREDLRAGIRVLRDEAVWEVC